MKLLHLADLHAKRERADELLLSLNVARKTASNENVDLIAISGDIWDSVIQNTLGSRFIEIIEAVRSLADVAPVAMIYGTPTHDVEGSLDVFETLDSKFGITVLRADSVYFLQSNGKIWRGDKCPKGAKSMLFGIPEPSKKWIENEYEFGSLFACLGILRNQYPELPCVLLYHGQITGAHLANGEVIKDAELRASVDLLEMANADYIAMGDIHEPQQVGNIPAYYPGSAYPVDFGETHEAGCNLVAIDKPNSPVVQRISFGHPINQTIRAELGLTEIDRDLQSEVQKGHRVKLEVTCSKERQAEVDCDELLKLMMDFGATKGSIVTLNVLPTETVRVGEITSKTKLRDKVTLYADNSKLAISEEILTKADEIETEAYTSGSFGRGDRIRLTRLVLRGAIGLWKKSGHDEVDISLEDLDGGLVALIGGNGSGKTTIIENMHPWPSLLTREGTLKDHFRLRDSFRELSWTDENSGSGYRALITINAAIASGTTEYWLYKDGQPVVGITGRKDDYVREIDRLFGSQELFLRSAFVTQRQPKGVPDLADATPKERKTLFSALCGLEYLEAYKLIAKAHKDEVEMLARASETEIQILTSRLPDPGEIQTEIETATASLEAVKEDLDILDKLGKSKAVKVDRLNVAVLANRQTEERIFEAVQAAQNTELRIKEAEILIARAKQLLELKPIVEREIHQHAELIRQRDAEQERNASHQEAIESERQIFETLREAHVAKVRKAYDVDNELQRQVAGSRSFLDALTREVDRGQAELDKPHSNTCPTCKQNLPSDALKHLQEAKDVLKTKLETSKGMLSTAFEAFTELEVQAKAAAQNRVDMEASAPKPPELPIFDRSTLNAIAEKLALLNVDASRKILQDALVAESRIADLTKQITDWRSGIIEDNVKIERLRTLLRPELEDELGSAQVALETTRTAYRDAQRQESDALASLKQANIKQQELDKYVKELTDLRFKLAATIAQVTEWAFLENACSDKGIQALELDAVAPSIAAIANGLLRDAFGSRYQIEFETTRTGKSRQQIEDFLIFIIDTETGERQEIATLSGGESVWIRRALYDAFGLVRARSTGLDFLTVFQDEADGALDPQQKLTYLRMLDGAHKRANRRHTIIITHDEGIQELITNRIEISKLKARGEKSE